MLGKKIVTTTFIGCLVFIAMLSCAPAIFENGCVLPATSQDTEHAIQISATDIAEGYAVVCGVSDYPGSDHDLGACDDDAYGVKTLAMNQFKLPEENVIQLIDSQATSAAITSSVAAQAIKMDSNDYLLFYFSGHGSCGPDLGTVSTYTWNIESSHYPYSNNLDLFWHYSAPGAAMMRVHFTSIGVEYGYDYVDVGDYNGNIQDWYDTFTGSWSDVWSYWVPTDDIFVNLETDYSENNYYGFRVDQVQVATGGLYEIIPYDGLDGGMTGGEIDTMLAGVPGKSIMVLDTCHSGGVGETVQSTGRYIMTASQANEFSLEDSSRNHGAFTYYFLNAWSVPDANGDGAVSLEETFGWISSNTISRTTYLGSTHHPQQYDGCAGETILEPNAHLIDCSVTGDTITVHFGLNGLGSGVLTTTVYDKTRHETEVITHSSNLVPATSNQTDIKILDAGDFTIDAFQTILTATYGDASEADSWYEDVAGPLFLPVNDADADGLSDATEFSLGMNPWNGDTDGDMMGDNDEVQNGLNPRVDDSMWDNDGDTLPNFWEVQYDLDPLVSNAGLDTDYDGLSDVLEYSHQGNPNHHDTDGDGLNDYSEYREGTSLINPDSDGDFFNDAAEVIGGHDPLNPMDSPLVHIFAITMVVLLPVFAVTGATNFGKGHEPSLPPMVKQRPRNKSATKTIQKSLPAYGSPAGSSLYGSTSLSSTTSSMPRVTFPPEIEMQLNRLPPFQREVVRQMLVEKVMQGLRAGGMPGQGAPAQIPAPAPAAAPVPAPAYKFCIKCGGPMTLGICSVCGWKPAGGN